MSDEKGNHSVVLANLTKLQADCISSIDEVIALHERELELLRKHRIGLIQHFLSARGSVDGAAN